MTSRSRRDRNTGSKDEVLEVAQTHPALRATRLCACGCGLSRTPTAKYRPGHRERLLGCRARFRRLRQYAKNKGIAFTITLKEIQDLLLPLADLGDSSAIERGDMTKGFEPGNLILRPKANTPNDRSARTQAETAVDENRLRDLLVKRAKRQVELCFGFVVGEPPVTFEDVLLLYARQGGRCAVTRVTFVLDKALHPESMALAKKNPLEPQQPKNSLLVTLAIKPFVDKWGVQYLRKVAKRIVRAKKEKS